MKGKRLSVSRFSRYPGSGYIVIVIQPLVSFVEFQLKNPLFEDGVLFHNFVWTISSSRRHVVAESLKLLLTLSLL